MKTVACILAIVVGYVTMWRLSSDAANDDEIVSIEQYSCVCDDGTPCTVAHNVKYPWRPAGATASNVWEAKSRGKVHETVGLACFGARSMYVERINPDQV